MFHSVFPLFWDKSKTLKKPLCLLTCHFFHNIIKKELILVKGKIWLICLKSDT